MRTLMLIIVIVVSWFLGGCATTQPITEVKLVRVETLTLIEPDPQYLADCQVAPPPSVDEYVAMGEDEREDALARTLMAQQAFVKLCNDDKRHVRDLITKQRAIVTKHNADQEARATAQQAALLKGQ